MERYYGSFTIEDVNLEMMNLQMDKNILLNISDNTGGQYVPIDHAEDIITNINNYNEGRSVLKSDAIEYRIWSDEWILISIILLFAVEWFLRKRMGML
jgi:hypothetical protein